MVRAAATPFAVTALTDDATPVVSVEDPAHAPSKALTDSDHRRLER
jgi:hypothetical protein